MYYKNVFQDIVASDFGDVSTLFDREPKTLLKLSLDYLYSQSYFNTLACLEDDNERNSHQQPTDISKATKLDSLLKNEICV